MFNPYQKIYPIYDLDSYRIAAVILYYLVGLETWKNAHKANYLRAHEGLLDPATIIVSALKEIDSNLVFIVGSIPTELAYHENRRWSFLGRDVVTNSEINSDIRLYASVLKQSEKGIFIMASKLSQFKTQASSIKNFVGQTVTFMSAEFHPNKFNPDENQAKARIMLEDGTTESVYCTPYISSVMEQVQQAEAFPLVAIVTSIPPRQKGQSMGYGLDDENVSPAKVKKLETMATALLKAKKQSDQKAKDYVEELDQKTGKWKKVKFPAQKAKSATKK